MLASATASGSLGEIDKAPLAIAANNVSKTYGGVSPSLLYGYEGLVGGDTVSVFSGTLSTAATDASNVGALRHHPRRPFRRRQLHDRVYSWVLTILSLPAACFRKPLSAATVSRSSRRP